MAHGRRDRGGRRRGRAAPRRRRRRAAAHLARRHRRRDRRRSSPVCATAGAQLRDVDELEDRAVSRRPRMLAVDGGGSKIDAALLRRDGTVLGAARVAAAATTSARATTRSSRRSTRRSPAACADAGLDPRRAPVADLGVFCLAGADLPVGRSAHRPRGSRGAAWTGEHVLRNDTFAVLRAGTDRPGASASSAASARTARASSPDGRDLPAPGRSAESRATGAAAATSARRRCGTRSARATAAATTTAPAASRARALRPARPAPGRSRRSTSERLDEDRARRARARRVRARRPPATRSRASSSTGRPTRSSVMATAAIRRLRHARRSTSTSCSGGGIFRNE